MIFSSNRYACISEAIQNEHHFAFRCNSIILTIKKLQTTQVCIRVMIRLGFDRDEAEGPRVFHSVSVNEMTQVVLETN